MMCCDRIPNAARWGAALFVGVWLAGCDGGARREPDGQGTVPAVSEAAVADEASPTAKDQSDKKSIIRPEIEQAPPEAPTPEPETLSVPFPEKGAAPDDTALAAVDRLIASPIFQAGGPITIWGHSDSAGSDSANLAASRRRAEAVRKYLESKGASGQRIKVIAMGEDRPIAPNRNLDGSDNPDGRARNRRVEIRIDPPAPTAEPHGPQNGSLPKD